MLRAIYLRSPLRSVARIIHQFPNRVDPKSYITHQNIVSFILIISTRYVLLGFHSEMVFQGMVLNLKPDNVRVNNDKLTGPIVDVPVGEDLFALDTR